MLCAKYIILVCLMCASGLVIADEAEEKILDVTTIVYTVLDETTVVYTGPTLSTEGITLNCSAENMTVTIPRETVGAGSMDGEDLKFEDSEDDDQCRGTVVGSNIILTTSLDGCETVRAEDNDTETYTNRVVNGYSTGSPISRQYVVDIPITCTYNRTKRVDQWYRLTDFTVDKTLNEEGAYDFDFFIYQMKDFTSPYTKYPIWLNLDEEFYFAASVLSIDNSIQLSMEHCKATPSSDYYDDTSYSIIIDFIENKEEEDINITCKHGNRDLVGVTMKTFRFIEGSEDEVYLHCDLIVCGTEEEDSVCEKQCSYPTKPPTSARRRRDVGPVPPLARKRLTRGPIRVMRSASKDQWSHHIVNEDNIAKDNGSTFSPWIIAMAAMASIVTALAAAMVMMMKKLNSIAASSQRRECLKEESVPLMADEE